MVYFNVSCILKEKGYTSGSLVWPRMPLRMDKRRLLKDIAMIRKQLFALTAFVGFLLVILATIMGRGFDPLVIFRNAVLGLVFFGVLGFLWGRIYEKVVERPLIESYREEARMEIEKLKHAGSERVAMDLSVSELTSGMRVLDPVYSKDGALLVREGAVLSDRLIQTLRENNVASIKIEAQRQVRENVSMGEE
jgi:hypothetical protein